MSGEPIPEQRAAVMILVDATWQDADGSLQTTRARMENKSNGGACIRVNTEIEPGTRVQIQSFREDFTGIVKYCRIDGKEFLIGLQRNSPSVVPAKPQLRVPIPKEGPPTVPQRDTSPRSASPGPAVKITGVAKTSTRAPRESSSGTRRAERATSASVRGLSIAARNVPSESAVRSSAPDPGVPVFHVPGVREVEPSGARMASEVHVLTLVPETSAWESRDNLQYQDFDVLRWVQLQTKQAPKAEAGLAETRKAELHKTGTPWPEIARPAASRTEEPRARMWARGLGSATRERNRMQRKWLDMGSWGEKDAANENNSAGDKDKNAPSVAPPFAKDRRGSVSVDDAGYQGELLPLEEVYRAAGITTPRGGYSIVKIAEMLQSEHLRGLAKDMRRASIMMALDAAGVAMNEVLRDAKARMEAIESYESEQRKLCEAEWARKEEENIQIRAELERVKAQYIARINRNLEAVAREKARFTTWQAANQQEAQNISDAAELCLKPAAPEPQPAPQPAAASSAPSPAAMPVSTSKPEAAIKVV